VSIANDTPQTTGRRDSRGKAREHAGRAGALAGLRWGALGLLNWLGAAGALYLTVVPLVSTILALLARRGTTEELPINLLWAVLGISAAIYLSIHGWRYLRGAFDPFAREELIGEMLPRLKEFRHSIHLMRKSALAIVGLAVVVVYVGIAVVGPSLAPFPYEPSFYETHVPPGSVASNAQVVAPRNAVTTTWTNASSGLRQDSGYARSANVSDVLYLLNFSVPLVFSPTTVRAVAVGVDANSTEGHSVNVSVSWDGGTHWAADQDIPFKTTDDGNLWYVDFSAERAWTNADLNTTNLWVRLTHIRDGSPSPTGTVQVEYVTVRADLVGPVHPWGTNELGEDMLAGILIGTGVDMRIGIIVVAGSLLIGVLLGVFSGYLGGGADEVIMRITDMFLAVPGLILALAFAAVLGRSLNNVLIALMLVSWPGYTRLIRGQVLSIREVTYVEAARAVGAKTRRVVVRHVLPNVVSVVIVAATLDIGTIVILTAALSFIGLGAPPWAAEWGIMIARGYTFMVSGFWWEYIPPGVAIFLFVLGFNLFGDGLRDILDPRLRR